MTFFLNITALLKKMTKKHSMINKILKQPNIEKIKKEMGGIILDTGCSLNCVFCGGHQKKINIQLKKTEIAAYKNLQDFKKEGIKKISISGSDPIEYKKIIELIKYIKKESFEFVKLSTHGERLSDLSFLKKLIFSGIDEIRMPIYGSNAKIHDSITKTKGSFKKIISGIKNLLRKKTKIEIQISSLIFKQNKDDLLNIVDLVDELGIKNFYFSIPCLTKKDYHSFYIPLKNLGLYIKKLYNYALKINDKTMFVEIPFCVFNVFNLKNINNTCMPPNLGKYNQPLQKYKTSIPDLPLYRAKKKISMCNNCIAFNYCNGFFINDIDSFGIGSLKPIKKIK